MKLQQDVQEQSRKTSGPWDDWLRDKEHKYCSPLSFQLQEIMRKETGRVSRSTPGSMPSVPGRFLGFWVMGQFTQCKTYLTDRVYLSQRGK